ncbi:MAG: hypothetical protein ACRYGO_07370 [Janthinobacterium lividum]
MTILAIDPGTTESGWCVYDGQSVVASGVFDNAGMLETVMETPAQRLAIEMIASYGMAVGREVFETCVWIGRFKQAFRDPDAVELVYRKDVKLHLCGTTKAKDPNVRQALLDLFPALAAARPRRSAPRASRGRCTASAATRGRRWALPSLRARRARCAHSRRQRDRTDRRPDGQPAGRAAAGLRDRAGGDLCAIWQRRQEG